MEVASIAGRFEIAGPVDAVEPHSGGHINEGHVVSAGGRRYLLQCLNPNVFHDPDAVMANVMAVIPRVSRT